MKVKIYPSFPSIENISVPSSKSLCHRTLICAALADGHSTIKNINYNDDVLATISCLEKLGAKFQRKENELIVKGIKDLSNYDGSIIDVNESGSTLRFLIPLFANTGKKCVFRCKGKLIDRPLDIYEEIIKNNKGLIEKKDNILTLETTFNSDKYKIRGNISSQFISGLFFLLPLLENDSTIELIPPVESISYLNLTLDTLDKAGIKIKRNELIYTIEGKQKYLPTNYDIAADDSSAAFFTVEAMLTNKQITINNMDKHSKQADHLIVDIIKKFNGNVIEKASGYTFVSNELISTDIDLADCPDLGPILFVLASKAKGTSVFRNVDRLRLKESDRILSMQQELNKVDCVVNYEDNKVYIEGKNEIKGGVSFDSHNDHRIAMALSILATSCKNPCVIENAEVVNKSYPNFFIDLKNTGVEVEYL